PRDPVWRAKLAALELLWPLHLVDERRVDELGAWRAEQGRSLEDFALFCALAEQHGVPWQSWPEELRRPDGEGIEPARARHAERVDFWCWVQLLVDEQLAGLGSDLVVGVIHDLAVGVDAGGADAWALQDALALNTTVGAPPDSFNQQGQDWGLPPWRPDRLAELGYLPFRDVVRGVLRHAGGLRIDHIMGLFRLWWVPAGATAAAGTYVSYDADAMLAVLALEASRAGALVVGEDLGTVEDRVRTGLAEAGVLGSSVLWFETEDGAFLPPEQWRELSLATVTTHDLPTAAGFLAEEHVRVRDELGQLGLPVGEERQRVRAERAALLDRLRDSGLLEAHGGNVVLAMHAMLTASPSRLVLAAFGDAAGDLRQPNLPGTVDDYPNWRLPVADGSGRPLGLEELLALPGVRRLAALLAEGVRAVGAPVR
ncbi:MAG: 4-alpha-glucanotransferase, partial [Actinobacteria bacterium]|nr:4-alpha-glucanotransferase [Actinomycetota bacterium]